MIIVGNRWETPTVLPNRTASIMRDVSTLIRSIEDRTTSASTDEDLFDICCDQFKTMNFSEVISPLSDVLDQTQSEIIDICLSTLLLTLRANPLDQSKLLIFLIYMVATCFHVPTSPSEDVASPPAPSVERCIRVTVGDIDLLTAILADYRKTSPFAYRVAKCLVPRLKPVLRFNDLYIEHSGFSALRDNQKESLAKDLSRGEETVRTVAVEPAGTEDVAVVSTETGAPIFQLAKQTRHNPELRRECTEIVKGLDDIIPPPLRSEETSALSLLAPKDVKMLLKNGRLSTPRKKSKH